MTKNETRLIYFKTDFRIFQANREPQFFGAHILERGEEYTFWGDSCLQYDACHKIISVKHGVC